MIQLPQLETARIAHDALKDTLAVQEQRHSILIAKTQTLATVAALLFASLGISNFDVWPSQAAAVASFLTGITSILFSLKVLMTREFWGIDTNNVLADASLLEAPEIMFVRMARTYEDAVKKTVPVVDDLYKAFDKAICALKCAAIFALLAFLLQLMNGVYMSNDGNNQNNGNGGNSGNSGNASTAAPVPTLSDITQSFGVQAVKRSLGEVPVRPTPLIDTEKKDK